MERLPEPISKRNKASAASFGVAILSLIVMIVWRWLLE